MAKKKTKKRVESKKIEEVVSTDGSLVDKLFIAGGVLLFILAFYGLTIYITNKNSNDTDEEKEKTVEVSKEEIIVGRSLSMSKNDYYVIYYDNDNSDTYQEIVNNYNKSIPIYKVNMSNGFNKKYIAQGESNKNPSKASDISINGPTLIKVSKNKVVEYYEGEETIRTILN